VVKITKKDVIILKSVADFEIACEQAFQA